MSGIMFEALRFTTKYNKIKKVFAYECSEQEDLERCPGCSGRKEECFRDFGCIDRYGFRAKTCWCSQCGLIFINPRMTLRGYNTFYEGGAYRNIIKAFSSDKRKGKAYGEKNPLPKRLKPIQDFFPHYLGDNKLKVLDIGGTKEIFEYLRTMLNIEKYLCINPAIGEMNLQEGSDFGFYHGTIEEFDSRGEKYDLICLFGTLNHLLEPKVVFDKINSLLMEDGIFVFDHVNRVAKMAVAVHPSHQVQIDHPIYPGTETVVWMLHQAGMVVEKTYTTRLAVEFYIAKKMGAGNLTEVDSVSLDRIKNLSRRMKSVPPKFFIKCIIKKLLPCKNVKI